MFKTLNEPYAVQIDKRLQDLNEFYTKEVMEWVLTAHANQLLCDSEWDARRHLLNLRDTFPADIMLDCFERMYPEAIQFLKLKAA